jgi:hypothetical protein
MLPCDDWVGLAPDAWSPHLGVGRGVCWRPEVDVIVSLVQAVVMSVNAGCVDVCG